MARRGARIAVACTLACCAVAGATWLGINAYHDKVEAERAAEAAALLAEQNAEMESQDPSSSEGEDGSSIVEEEAVEPELPENPINFVEQKLKCGNIIAWIDVPGTSVSYPVVQHPSDDFYYLDHSIENSYSPSGSIYIQLANSYDFTDPVTVIYGHNNSKKTMFSTLHNFEDEAFFKEHDTFTIYRPGHILTYKIVSAYMFDNRHILNSYNFNDSKVLEDYFAYVQNPDSLVKNVRKGLTIEPESRIVQLSTCLSESIWDENRFIVTGVLVDDEPTQ